MDSTISLCAVADAGQVAVVTDSTDSVAKLTVYNSSMQQQLVWNLTSEQGTPLRMAFAPDSRRLAVAAVSAVGGQLTTNLYVLPLSQGDPVCLGSENSVPQWMGWMSNGFLLVLYENRACCTTRAAAAQANAPATILAAVPSSVCPTPVTVRPCC